MVKKYDRIHDEGPGRRLLFTLKESSGLTDLRRRIGLHEQTLNLWYWTLVYGSLRRLETGQEAIAQEMKDMFATIREWSPRKQAEIRRSVRHGDLSKLEDELQRSKMSETSHGGGGGHGRSRIHKKTESSRTEADEEVLNAAANYLMADPSEKFKLEVEASNRATQTSMGHTYSHKPEEPMSAHGPPMPHYESHMPSSGRPIPVHDFPPSVHYSDLSRRRSTGHGRARPHFDGPPSPGHIKHDRTTQKAYATYGSEDSESEVVIEPGRSRRSRRTSEESKNGLRSPLLVVPDTGPKYRSSSAKAADEPRAHRSPDRRLYEDKSRGISIVLEPPKGPRRSASRRSSKSHDCRLKEEEDALRSKEKELEKLLRQEEEEIRLKEKFEEMRLKEQEAGLAMNRLERSASQRSSKSGRHHKDEGAEQVVVINYDDERPRRSSSQRSNKSERHQRDSSAHSFTRVRPSGSGREAEIRMVTRMDRIDSVPVTDANK